MKLSTLAEQMGARIVGDVDVDVVCAAGIDVAGVDAITIAVHAHERARIGTTRAAAVIVDDAFVADHADAFDNVNFVCGDDPAQLLARAIAVLHPAPSRAFGVHPRASVHPSAVLGAGVVVNAGAVIDEDVVVGDGCVIGANAVVLRGVRLGARVVVGPGTVIGDEGFVYVPAGDRNVVVPAVKAVVVDDDVIIGANVCIDRGLLRDTHIGAGTRIDNLVQVAHDVVLGRDVVVVAQVGIAGYAEVGDGVVLGGQAGVNPHVRLARRVRVGGKAGVVNDVDVEGAAVAGFPARPHAEWLKHTVRLQKLASSSLVARLQTLEAQLRAFTAAQTPAQASTPAPTLSTVSPQHPEKKT